MTDGSDHPAIRSGPADAGSSEIAATRTDDQLERDASAGALTRGTTVGRYVVLERLGSGAMGVVYGAWDPELDRKLAIKLLRPKSRSARRAAVARARMVLEAKAMAKLSHPNVVQIHDVGEIDGRAFVAMEYVEGTTLRQWLAAEPRPWREALAVLTDAGRGLAAAHAAGLVHRDFKPDNVLVADDGRVQVLDFGLARAVQPQAASDSSGLGPLSTSGEEGFSSASADGADDRSMDAVRLTRVGARVGTPAYMSPEQHLGGEADARSDQFSFCIATWEAVFGAEPFGGATSRERAEEVAMGRLRPPPPRHGVPGHVVTALTKGLRVEPDDRFAEMADLLAALNTNPGAKWRRVGVATAVGLTLAAGVTFAALARSDDPVCATGDLRLAGAWSPARTKDVEEAFASLGVDWSARSFERVRLELDDYAAAWLEAHTDACEDSRLRKEHSEALMDLRIACLGRIRSELDATTRLLARSDLTTVENSLSAVRALPPVDECSDVRMLQAQSGAELDPKLAAEIEDMHVSASAARAKKSAGLYDDALRDITALAEQSGSLAHPGARAALCLLHADILEANGRFQEAETMAVRAAGEAERAGDTKTLAQARLLAALVVGDRAGRVADGRHWLEQAAVAIERLGDDTMQARLHSISAMLADREGNHELELEEHERALELARSHDADPLVLARMRANVAYTLAQTRRPEEALVHAQAALDTYVAELGPSHPLVATGYAAIAYVHDYQGEYAKAAKIARLGVALMESAVGPDNPRVAELLNNLAIDEVNLGELDAAATDFARVVDIREKTLGSEHLETASALANLAGVHRMQAKFDSSLEMSFRALEIRRKHLDPDHPEVVGSLASIANVHEDQGRYDQALPLREQVLRSYESRYGPGSPMLLIELANLAWTMAKAGRAAAAQPFAERAVTIAQKHEVKPDERAFAHVVLAKVLVSRGAPSAQVRSRLERAQEAIIGVPAGWERKLIAEVAEDAQLEGFEVP